ncbi:TonB-dependent receptor [Sphingobium sp. BYY-5]|uniref:TonB-dependent receptor n=1 Tax=Sphingobium sp. BYY-5 TaxID=2926400 RepID=UPI001FA6F69E|nr:TonB-dependent receptor [Sphingobium sp. BYY-5]MCI4588934.1 TonB-dependent receptor [Sphingobium sp. BYY-5]
MPIRLARFSQWKCAAAMGAFALSAAANVERAYANPTVIDIPAGPLAGAIDALSRQARISVAVQGRLPAIRTRAVRGRMEPGEALARLLAGSGWRARQVAPALWQLVRAPEGSRPTTPPPRPAQHPITPPLNIVVTALKREQLLSSAPVSIAVAPGDRFAGGSSARGSSDLGEEVGSVFSTHMGPGKERLFLRGVADSPFNGPTQSTVGLFLDDARINYALPDPDLRLVDIDRVEVLRGPQGTLYGAGTLGGVVRIDTNRPRLDESAGGIAIEGSTVARGGDGGALEGWVNVPLIRDRLGLRAVAYVDRDGGWIDDSERQKTNINSVRRLGGRVNLRWKPDARWTMDLSVVAQGLKARDTSYATEGLTRATALAEPNRNNFLLVRIDAKGPIGGIDFLSSTAIENNNVVSRYDASAVAGSVGLAGPTAYDEKRSIYLITQEFRLSRSQGPFKWLAGVSIVDAVNVNFGTFNANSGGSVQVRRQGNLSLEAAAFGEGTLALRNNLDLTLGVRAFVSNIWDDPRKTSDPSIDQYGLSPSAALAWRPTPGSLLWVRYASAVRPGGRNLDGAGTLVTFASDKLHNIELGSRLSLLDGHLDLDLTGFALRWHNVQSDRVGLDGLVVTTNVGDASNYGIETAVRGTWRDFALELSATRQHGRLESALIEDSDLRLPVLPDISGRARLSWNRQVNDWGLGAYMSANYWGPTRLGFDPNLPLDIGARWLVGAGVSASRDGWRAVLSVSNLLDNRSNSFSFGNPFTYRLQPQFTPQQPRTVMLRLERSF